MFKLVLFIYTFLKPVFYFIYNLIFQKLCQNLNILAGRYNIIYTVHCKKVRPMMTKYYVDMILCCYVIVFIHHQLMVAKLTYKAKKWSQRK